MRKCAEAGDMAQRYIYESLVLRPTLDYIEQVAPPEFLPAYEWFQANQDILPSRSFNRYAVDNYAEVDAVNNALNAGASLGNLRMIVIHANDTRLHSFGDIKPSCENCTYAFRGRIQKNYSGWEEAE